MMQSMAYEPTQHPPGGPYEGAYYDESKAQLVLDFFPRYLRHVEGRWAGKPFLLEQWQQDFLAPIFGWRTPSGHRLINRAYLEVPRKNGKTTLLAGIIVYLLFGDHENAPQCYSAAGAQDQARALFRLARFFVEDSPKLRRHAKLLEHTIVNKANRGYYRVLTREARTKHGFNVHGAVVDEVHALPSRDIWDVLTTATGSREQPICCGISTASSNRHGICWELHQHTKKVMNWQKTDTHDPHFFGKVYGIPIEADWEDKKLWYQANPNLDVSFPVTYLEGQCDYAKANPSYQNTFRQLHLGQWTSQAVRWMPMDKWEACHGPVMTKRLMNSLRTRPCWGGLDLSSTTDLTAFALAFEPAKVGGVVQLLVWSWVPEDNLLRRVKQDGVPYNIWADQGFIIPTPGAAVDYVYVMAFIEKLADMFDLQAVAFDRWGAKMMVQLLEQSGMEMIQFGQGYASMSPAMKEVKRLTFTRRLGHNSNPVLSWCTENLVADTDPAGNVKPNKEKSVERIDAFVATTMAVGALARHTNEGEDSATGGGLVTA